MAKQRLQVDSGLDPVAVRPAARPVDAYAQTNEGLELAQLARGLSDIAPTLGRFAGVLTERANEGHLQRGEQAMRKLEEQRITYKDAIAKGLIRPSENPWFLLGAKRQAGRASAGQYARALRDAIAMDPEMQESENPKDFSGFEAAFRKQWLAENVGEKRDLHFEKGFAIVDGLTSNVESAFASAALSRIEKRAGDNLQEIIGQVLDSHFTEEPTVAANLVQIEMESYLYDNPKAGRLANKAAVNAIASWARANYRTVGREDVEKLLRDIKGGTGSLFGTSEAKEMMIAVEKDIISMRGAASNLAHNEEIRAEQAKEKVFWSETLPVILESAKKGELAGLDLTQYASALTAIDPSPEAATAIFRLRDNLINAKGNDLAYRQGLLWVHGVDDRNPGSLLSIKRLASYAAAEGLTGAQTNSILAEIQQRDQQGDSRSGSKFLNDPMVNAGESFIRQKMVDLYGTNPALNRHAAANAIAEFQVTMIRNRAKLLELPDEERAERILKLAETAYRVAAPESILKADIKAGDAKQQNVQTLTSFDEAMKRATENDAPAINRALREWQTKSDESDFSPATGALLFRLGIPLKEEEIKSFFIEWQRRNNQ